METVDLKYILHNIQMKKYPSEYEIGVIRNKRLHRILNFKQIIHTSNSSSILQEFIRLSRLVCGAKYNSKTEVCEHPYDYDKMVLIEDCRFGERILSSFEPCISINDLRVIIPCRRCGSTDGVSCKLIDHLMGIGCRECVKICKLKRNQHTTERFILLAEIRHNVKEDIYLYNNTDYVYNNVSIQIFCIKCYMYINKIPSNHINAGSGCQKCGHSVQAASLRYTFDDFVRKARNVHGDKYDYIELEDGRPNRGQNIKYECNICGYVNIQSLSCHVNKSNGCRQCAKNKIANIRTRSFKEITDIANEKHNSKYTYIEILPGINSSDRRIVYNCPDCNNVMNQRVSGHLHGYGCFCRVGGNGRDMSNTETPLRLYYIKLNITVNGESNVLYKIGITKNTVEERMYRELMGNNTYEILLEQIFNPGCIAYQIEQIVKRSFKPYRYRGKRVLRLTSNSEIFRVNILSEIINIVNIEDKK